MIGILYLSIGIFCNGEITSSYRIYLENRNYFQLKKLLNFCHKTVLQQNPLHYNEFYQNCWQEPSLFPFITGNELLGHTRCTKWREIIVTNKQAQRENLVSTKSFFNWLFIERHVTLTSLAMYIAMIKSCPTEIINSL